MSYGSQWEQGREPISPITQGPSERHTVLLSLYCVLGLLWWPHSHREAPGWGIPARCQTGFLWRQETIFWLFVPLLCFHSLSRPCNPYVSIIMMIDLEMLCFVAHSDLQFKQLRSTNEQMTTSITFFEYSLFVVRNNVNLSLYLSDSKWPSKGWETCAYNLQWKTKKSTDSL